MRCPSCDSPAPHLHPAVQYEGEVQPCNDDFHRKVTSQNTPKRIAANDRLLSEFTAAVANSSERFMAAEVGRDQANKERDEAREALRVARNDISAIALNGWDSTRIALGNEAVARIDAALAGVPGGGQQDQDLGGDRGRSPVVGSEEA